MSDGQYFRQGKASALNISAPTQVSVVSKDQAIGQSRIVRVNVVVAGTTAGSVNDSATVAGAVAANEIESIPSVVGPILLDFPIFAGIVIIPGTGQVVSVSYD
jgi:hypothetical protein